MSEADLTMTIERLSRVLQNAGHRLGLKPVQWEALRFLARANRFSRTPTGLTAYLGITKGTVSQTLNVLERKDLVKKATDPNDRRNVRLELTKRAVRLLLEDQSDDILEAASLANLDLEALDELLQQILRHTLTRRGQRLFGECRTCRYFENAKSAPAPYYCSLLNEPLVEEDSRQICVEQELTPST